MSLLDRHIDFVEALRGAGLPVSLAEDLDAVAAVRHLDLLDREAVRAGYAATLVKKASHRSSFDAVFDLFYPPLLGTGVDSTLEDEPLVERDSAEALRAFREELAAALAEGDEQQLQALAREGVGRFGAMRGRGQGMSSWSAYNTLQRTSPDTLILRVAQALLAEMDNDAAMSTAARRVESFNRLVESEARRRIAEEKSPAYVASATLRPTIDQVAFLGARKNDLEQMRREIYPLARRLATRLAKEQHRKRRGPLDFRRTVRASVSTGGVPLTTHHRPKRPHRTELVVLCDVSGSVANFAQFTLMLVFALRDQFTKVRAFTFVDDIHEVTHHFAPGGDLVTTMENLAGSIQHASLWGRTNYGRAFTRFLDQHPDALGPKTSLLVLGDARSNYADLALPVVRDIRSRTRHAWWLNPEHTRQWDTGDSAALPYGELIPMVECRNLTQLGEFVHKIL
ncbi:MAG TPA: VWA domain-containing protein [Nocardioidaceae bacterium]|nr:VWA domain-containing protein [Nocardioidaceae bacterium]